MSEKNHTLTELKRICHNDSKHCTPSIEHHKSCLFAEKELYSSAMEKRLFILLTAIALSLFSCATGNHMAVSDKSLNDTRGLAEEIVRELNFVRTNPKQYATEVLEPRLKHFEGKIYAEPGKVRLLTREGIAALQECISVLKTTAAVEPLTLEKGLCQSAQWLANDQARTRLTGHTGSDGSDLGTRICRYGTWSISCGENCAYGNVTAREIVVQLLIDDGVPNRGHRKNILEQKFKKVGIGFNKEGNAPYGAVAVMDFAGSYTSK